jgi:excisionase family DNA binding protein
MDDKILLSFTETAKALSVCRGTIYNLVKSGALKRVSVGTAPRIPVDSLRSYLASLDAAAN